MTAITTNIGTQDTVLLVDTPLANAGPYPWPMQIDSEIVYVTGGKGTTQLSVVRGCEGTTPAAHSIGATVAASSGANLTEAEHEALDHVGIPGVGAVFYGAEDPGAVGVGAIWVRPQEAIVDGPVVLIRNDADDGWAVPILARYSGADVIGYLDLAAGSWGARAADDSYQTLIAVGEAGGGMSSLGEGAQLQFAVADGGTVALTIIGAGMSITGLPTSNPNVAGRLWVDTTAGLNALKVSQG